MTKKYRKRGVPGPEIDAEAAIRNVLKSLEKRGVVKRANNFEILKSKVPDTPNSLAVHQDGSDYCKSYINSGDLCPETSPCNHNPGG